jgi:hypothetical protein
VVEARLNDPENLLSLADGSILFAEAGNQGVRLIDRGWAWVIGEVDPSGCGHGIEHPK